MKAIEEFQRLRDKLRSGDLPPDEPVFILRGRDLLAAGAVTSWAVAGRSLGVSEDRCNEAMRLAQRMRDWPVERVPGQPETEKAS